MPSPGSRSSQWWPSAALRVVAAGSRTFHGFLLVGAADGFVPDSAECKMGSCAMVDFRSLDVWSGRVGERVE